MNIKEKFKGLGNKIHETQNTIAKLSETKNARIKYGVESLKGILTGATLDVMGYLIPSAVKIVYDTINGLDPLEATMDIAYLKYALYGFSVPAWIYGIGNAVQWRKVKKLERDLEKDVEQKMEEVGAVLEEVGNELDVTYTQLSQTMENHKSEIEDRINRESNTLVEKITGVEGKVGEVYQKIGEVESNVNGKLHNLKVELEGYLEKRVRKLEEENARKLDQLQEVLRITHMDENELKEYLAEMLGEEYVKEEIATPAEVIEIYKIKEQKGEEEAKQLAREKVLRKREKQLDELLNNDEILKDKKGVVKMILGEEELEQLLFESGPEIVYGVIKARYDSFMNLGTKVEAQETLEEEKKKISKVYGYLAKFGEEMEEIRKKIEDKIDLIHPIIVKIEEMKESQKYSQRTIEYVEKTFEEFLREGVDGFENADALWQSIRDMALTSMLEEGRKELEEIGTR